MWIEKGISQSYVVSKAIFSLGLFEHFLDGIHSFKDPFFGKFHFIGSEFFVDFFEESEILVGMNSGVDDLTKSFDLGLECWIMGEEGKLGMDLFEKLADCHGLDEDFSVFEYERGDGLNDMKKILHWGLT